jgi:hypothetical protein
MIPYNELRIGNYVNVANNIQKVSMINKTGISTEDPTTHDQTEQSLASVEPIGLTDTILKQSGFIFHDYFKFWQLITTDTRSELDVSPDYEVIDFMRKPIAKKLTSLHQLQNIYFLLKGRELLFDNK